MIVSRRRGSALKRAKTSNFKPLIVEIVLRGLKTRKALSPFRLNEIILYFNAYSMFLRNSHLHITSLYYFTVMHGHVNVHILSKL